MMHGITLKSTALVGMAAALVMTAGMGGCRYDGRPADRRATAVSPHDDVRLRTDASRRTTVVGEVVTFTARTENLLGRDAEVRWTAPGGELRTEQDGRIARVIFDEPGTYSVAATLFIDGNEVRRDSKTITVNPLR